MFEYTMRCTLGLPLPLYNCITVDMLFYIVGHKIDGNYESWKYMGQKTVRDRLAPGRGPSFPHPGVRRFFDAVQIIVFSYFLKTTVNTLIEDIFLYDMILWDLC